jgi:hypothetical protein
MIAIENITHKVGGTIHSARLKFIRKIIESEAAKSFFESKLCRFRYDLRVRFSINRVRHRVKSVRFEQFIAQLANAQKIRLNESAERRYYRLKRFTKPVFSTKNNVSIPEKPGVIKRLFMRGYKIWYAKIMARGRIAAMLLPNYLSYKYRVPKLCPISKVKKIIDLVAVSGVEYYSKYNPKRLYDYHWVNVIDVQRVERRNKIIIYATIMKTIKSDIIFTDGRTKAFLTPDPEKALVSNIHTAPRDIYFPFIGKQIRKKNDKPYEMSNQRAIDFVRRTVYSEQILQYPSNWIFSGVYDRNICVTDMQKLEPIIDYPCIYKRKFKRKKVFKLNYRRHKLKRNNKLWNKNKVFGRKIVKVRQQLESFSFEGIASLRKKWSVVIKKEPSIVTLNSRYTFLRFWKHIRERFKRRISYRTEKKKVLSFKMFVSKFVSPSKVVRKLSSSTIFNYHDVRFSLGNSLNVYADVVNKFRISNNLFLNYVPRGSQNIVRSCRVANSGVAVEKIQFILNKNFQPKDDDLSVYRKRQLGIPVTKSERDEYERTHDF